MEGQDDTHDCVVDGVLGPTKGEERVRARVPKGQARHVGPRELGLGAAAPLFLPRLPLIFAPSLFPREFHSPLSQFLSLSVTLLFISYPFFIFIFL